ncbi:hypothetical protein, partial [Mycolicibacterium austroafricanum]|uniref:hypothetical protein n=1 Tax=Mycolicibacterium austroafricanum TaxID=39687 RepID=UPI00055C1ACA
MGARNPQHRKDDPVRRPGDGGVRRAPAPDDRHTTVIPPVRDGAPPPLRDPIDAVKRALDGGARGERKNFGPPKQPPPSQPL